jgi:hypothetical protein
MRSLAPALVVALAAAGCATPKKVTVPPEETKLTTISFDRIVDVAEDLLLYNGNDPLVLGKTRAEALQVFEPPADSRSISALPANLGKDFTASGWESENLSFGCISFEHVSGPEDGEPVPEQVVFAMYTQDAVDEDIVTKTVSRYTQEFGEPTNTIPGRQIRYWFWIRPKRWLMVNTSVSQSGRTAVTVALGAPQIMREMRMAVDLARADQALAIERLSNNQPK